MIRSILVVIFGLAVGMGVNMALVMFNAYVLFPMPAGTDMNDPDQLNAYIAILPTPGFFVVMAAHLGQSFVGGWVAARLGSSSPMMLAMTVGMVSLVGGIMMTMNVEAPTWTMIELPLYLVVAWQAGRIEVNRRAATAS
ncbi:MAG: hypothetical protein MK209_10030 [Planctomycetes bacterium]|nr:hypothetical protein [Planctomycetota bacterium]